MLKRLMVGGVCCTMALGAASCGDTGTVGPSKVRGRVAVEGSPALQPFTLKAEKAFNELTGDKQTSFRRAEDSAALNRFCSGQIDVAAVTQSSMPAAEGRLCRQNGIAYHRLAVAHQAAVVVANKALAIDCLTTAQLRALWQGGSRVNNYSQLGSSLPDRAVSLYGPTTSSSIFSFFTARINRRAGNSRRDYRPFVYPKAEQFARAVANDKAGFGYFDYAWVAANLRQPSVVAVDGGSGCVKPTAQTVQDGSYAPLSRLFYFYFDLKQLVKDADPKTPDSAVATFLQVTLANAATFAKRNYVVGLTPEQITSERIAWLKALKAYEATGGSVQ